jgi:hypothetical protein
MNRQFYAPVVVAFSAAVLLLSGCSGMGTPEAEDVNKNLTQDADNFKIFRKVSLLNTRTNAEMVRVEGRCSVEVNDALSATVLCKTDDGKYVRHGMTRSTDTVMVWEQLEASDTSASHYQFTLRPGALVPNIQVNPTAP